MSTITPSIIRTLLLPLHCIHGASLTHAFCNCQAIEILLNDNHKREADFFTYYLPQLDKGVNWADKGFGSFYHFYDIETGTGKWYWPNATATCEMYFNKALNLWRIKSYDIAMFYLGAATHLVQDMCVPHHARCTLTDGHVNFEKWTKKHRKDYCVYEDGLYLEMESPGDWVHLNATFSAKYFPLVQTNSSEEEYHLATSVLLPRTQRSTSGFWLWFYKLIMN